MVASAIKEIMLMFNIVKKTWDCKKSFNNIGKSNPLITQIINELINNELIKSFCMCSLASGYILI